MVLVMGSATSLPPLPDFLICAAPQSTSDQRKERHSLRRIPDALAKAKNGARSSRISGVKAFAFVVVELSNALLWLF